MQIARVDILDLDKLETKHGVRSFEVRQVFWNAPHFRFAARGNYQGENVYTAFGQTDGGRFLVVFFIYKLNRVALVISARDMESRERRLYERK